MRFLKYTSDIHTKLCNAGYKYLIQGKELSATETGGDEKHKHYQIVPVRYEPVDEDVYVAIDSLEGPFKSDRSNHIKYWINESDLICITKSLQREFLEEKREIQNRCYGDLVAAKIINSNTYE